MKIRDLRQKSDSELKRTLINLRDKLRELRFNLGGGKVKNIKEIHQTKKDIARILTLLKQHVSPKAEKKYENSKEN